MFRRHDGEQSDSTSKSGNVSTYFLWYEDELVGWRRGMEVDATFFFFFLCLIFLSIKQFCWIFFMFLALEGFLIAFATPSLSVFMQLKSGNLTKKKVWDIDFPLSLRLRSLHSRFILRCVAKLENNSVERERKNHALIDQEETSKKSGAGISIENAERRRRGKQRERANRAYQKMEIIQSSHHANAMEIFSHSFSSFFLQSHRCQKVYISFDIVGTMLSRFSRDVCCQNMRFSCHCHSFNIILSSWVCRRLALACERIEKMTLHFAWHKTTVLFTYGWADFKKYIYQQCDTVISLSRCSDLFAFAATAIIFLHIDSKKREEEEVYSNLRYANWIWLLCWCIQCCDMCGVNPSLLSASINQSFSLERIKIFSDICIECDGECGSRLCGSEMIMQFENFNKLRSKAKKYNKVKKET